jgi:hypothetical protein
MRWTRPAEGRVRRRQCRGMGLGLAARPARRSGRVPGPGFPDGSRLATFPGRVLDACAAPGGRRLVADAGGRRPPSLPTSWSGAPWPRRALGSPNVRVVAPMPSAAVRGPFDTLLLDAPCSGLGDRPHRHPMAGRPATFPPCGGRGHAGALAGWSPGGRLVYGTCSSGPRRRSRAGEFLAAGFASHTPGSGRDGSPPAVDGPADAIGRPFFAARWSIRSPVIGSLPGSMRRGGPPPVVPAFALLVK